MAGRQAWEYRILWLPAAGSADELLDLFDRRLTEAGRNGWEAVSMNETRILLKRRYP